MNSDGARVLDLPPFYCIQLKYALPLLDVVLTLLLEAFDVIRDTLQETAVFMSRFGERGLQYRQCGRADLDELIPCSFANHDGIVRKRFDKSLNFAGILPECQDAGEQKSKSHEMIIRPRNEVDYFAITSRGSSVPSNGSVCPSRRNGPPS